eukprot:1135262-Pleurochrysis_carterae.AAC.5
MRRSHVAASNDVADDALRTLLISSSRRQLERRRRLILPVVAALDFARCSAALEDAADRAIAADGKVRLQVSVLVAPHVEDDVAGVASRVEV